MVVKCIDINYDWIHSAEFFDVKIYWHWPSGSFWCHKLNFYFALHQEFFTYFETSPTEVKKCHKFRPMHGSWGHSSEGSLLWHVCCDTGPRFWRFHPKGPLLFISMLSGWWRSSHFLFNVSSWMRSR